MKARARLWALALFALLMSVTANSQTWYSYRDATWNYKNAGDYWKSTIEVRTAEQLAQLAWAVNELGETFENKIVLLKADIDLNKVVNGQRVRWIPIGFKNREAFKGVFVSDITTEGGLNKTYTISGMYVDLCNTYSGGVVSYAGLFGYCQGFLGYFTLESPEVRFSQSLGYWENIGTVCGMLEGTSCKAYVSHTDNKTNDLPCGIRGVTVRNAKITVDGTNYGALGGIVGMCKGYGVSHSTMTGTITANSIVTTGGIAGITEVYSADGTTAIPSITDCSVQATIISKVNNAVGGIAGEIRSQTVVNACSSMGTINTQKGHTGGIVGVQSPGTTISGCSSTATISGTENIGGIVGTMSKNDNGTSMIEHCAYSGHIDASAATYAGGLCGKLEWERNEHITDCLFLGTMSMPSSRDKCSATVGYNTKPGETVSMCYYDKSLFNGKVAPGLDDHVTCEGLTTAKLTSGNFDDVPYLNVDKGDGGFTLVEGRYPTVYSKTLWKGYNKFSSYTGGESWNAMFALQRTDNVTYLAGTWLCSLPAVLKRGDVAYDFVSTVTSSNHSSKQSVDGRTMMLMSVISFSDAPCIKISDKTATAIGEGSFKVTIKSNASTDISNYDRPTPLSGSKELLLNAAFGKPWDGTTAEAIDNGSGTAEDPYIIRNGSQLAYAVQKNKAGEFYEQICDIVINEGLMKGADPNLPSNPKPWISTTTWAAHYDGTGHIIYGAYIRDDASSFFGDVAINAEIGNVGIAESVIIRGGSGLLARNVDGMIYNCFVQGTSSINWPQSSRADKAYGVSRAGGICSTVGLHNPNAVVEDCISAYFNQYAFCDYTPFVSLNDANHGVVRNCLSVVPVYYADTEWDDYSFSAAGHNYIRDCYWLKGYEASPTGQTLDNIGKALGNRARWQWSPGYFPTLKSFAESDIAKLMMIPIRTDKDYNEQSNANFLLAIGHQQEFEPGAAQWELIRNDNGYVDADGDMGLISPVHASLDPSYMAPPASRVITGLVYLRGTFGRSSICIPMRTMSGDVSKGITFVDHNAREACLQAFDADGNGWLSLGEVKAVTPGKALTAFQTPTARNIRQFPELRFFKGITELTTQLNGLSRLEEVELPYALQTLGTEAFKGCDNLKTVTLPSNLAEVKPRAFYGSVVDSIKVDVFNKQFIERDGILLTADNRLISVPNGRAGEECTVSGTISAIADGAIYKVEGLRRLYFDTTDYLTVPQLTTESIVTADGSMLDVYVSDATEDQSLMAAYKKSTSWTNYLTAKKLHSYFPLKIGGDLSITDVNGQRRYVTTMCLGFDTELPSTLTPYIVEQADREHYKAYLTDMPRRVPAMSAVIVYATQPGLYRLSPLEEKLDMWPLYENRLVGTNRNGMPLNQSSSAQGNVMMPGYTSGNSQLGFYHDRGKEVGPYKAYLPYSTIGMDKDIARNAHYDIVYTWQLQDPVTIGAFVYNVYRNQIRNTGRAILARYTGSDRHVTVPSTITVGNGSTDVVQVAPRAFAGSQDNIWTIDMSGLTKMDFVNSDRTAYDTPLSGLNSSIIVFLPEGKAAPADNVVIGYDCQKLTLTDGHTFTSPVEFSATTATLNREFSATRTDNAWSSRAYTVSLPFDAECPAGVTLYQLQGINESKRQVVFRPADGNYITAGEPYLMVVNEGSFRLTAQDAYITKTNAAKTSVDAWPAETGSNVAYWQATYDNINANTAAQNNVYVLQDDGTFKRVLSDYPEANVSSFRAVITPQGSLNRKVYIIALEKGDGTTQQLGAASYTADAVMPDYSRFDNDRVAAAIWTESNKTLTFATLPYTTKVGDSFSGRPVTALWRDDEVTASGDKVPQWTSESYAHGATNIVFDPSFADCLPTSLYAWFKDMTSLTVIDLSGADFHEVTDARLTFAGCSELTTIFSDESSPIPLGITNDRMFEGCVKLKGDKAYNPEDTDGNWANFHYGYLTPCPYVIWCAGSETLHFLTADRRYTVGEELYFSNGTSGGTITQMWRGLQVYNVGWGTPGWNSIHESVKHVVIDRTFSVQRPKSLYCWFGRFSECEDIKGLEYLNTSETTNMNSAFMSCKKLKSLYLNTFDVSNVTNVTSMFRDCSSLTTIWCDKTWNIQTSQGMFFRCSELAGAAKYDSQKTEVSMANPETGYFTRVPEVEFIDLADNSEKLRRYDGQHVHAKCTRTFSATQKKDGSWTSKAYTVCLPFGIDVYQQVGNHEDVAVYYLQSVRSNNEFVFYEARYRENQWSPNVMLPGEPYVVVVRKGTFKLEANNALITATPVDMEVLKQVGDSDFDYELGGYWRGTFANISNDDATNMRAHTMTSKGIFRRISNTEERYRGAYVGTFRAFYTSIADDGFPDCIPMYQPETQGDDELGDGAIRDFPADTYDGDDASLYPTAVSPIIHTVDIDGTHRYFDLQGRPLSTPPAKGAYIDNGIKRINKK